MEVSRTLLSRKLNRAELYKMVWQKPMIHLAEEFGISGNGLAKICDRLDVPYPPRGYWAKKEAGKPVITVKLPPRKEGIPETVDIQPSLSKPALREPLPEATVEQAGIMVVSENIDNVHPRVQAWINEHNKLQKEREQESKRRRHESWWRPRLLPDLTERDLYRFRVTSAIFRAVEKSGGKIASSPLTGKITFVIDGHEVECSIVEKMQRSLKQHNEQGRWTAYPDHHQSGLESSGYLRVAITTYLNGRQPQWVENDKTKMEKWLPEIVGTIMSAGPILERAKLEREDAQRRYEQEQARIYELRRQKELDDKRWKRFNELAANWEERANLQVFIAEIEARLAAEGDVMISERLLSEWITWAKSRADSLDPFRAGVRGIFESISKITQWS